MRGLQLSLHPQENKKVVHRRSQVFAQFVENENIPTL
jgi:hypothetical protein